MRCTPYLVALTIAGALAECDAVFGLSGRDATVADADPIDADPCPDDRDCDLVLDAVDNCVDIANSDQDDIDDDDIGDLCDACLEPRSATADDDLDGMSDATDQCPHVADELQPDADGDGIGDACDPQPGMADALSCFLSFREPGPTASVWSIAAPWIVQVSRLEHTPAAATPPAVVAVPSQMLPASTRFELATPFVYVGTATQPFATGIGIDHRTDPARGVRCVIDGVFQTSQSLTIRNAVDEVLETRALPSLAGAWRLVLRVEPAGGGESVVTCRIDGTAQQLSVTAAAELGDDLDPRMIAAGTHTAFSSLAIVRLGP